MSDQADVLYDPRSHTHTSCLREVENCDMIVVVIGSRFGGVTVPKALELIDLTRLSDLSHAENFADDKTKISITQAEVIRAIQKRLPVFAFVDAGVMRDHLTYEKNKAKSIISEIDFSSIDKRETAPYIFEFINFLRLRNENNSVFEFGRFEDVEGQIKKQWAGLFQRLLHDQRERAIETRRIDDLSSQIADLKAAVLGSISSNELKETAKGAIRYRVMIDFMSGLSFSNDIRNVGDLLYSQQSWDELIKQCDVMEIKSETARNRLIGTQTIMLKGDGTYYRARLSPNGIARLGREWDDFKRLGKEAKNAIINAVLDSRQGRPTFIVRHYDEPFVEETTSVTDADVEDEFPENRILLTEEKFMEESIKNYLNAGGNFQGSKFLVDVKDHKVSISLLPTSIDGKVRNFTYEYASNQSGNLRDATKLITESFRNDFLRLTRNPKQPVEDHALVGSENTSSRRIN